MLCVFCVPVLVLRFGVLVSAMYLVFTCVDNMYLEWSDVPYCTAAVRVSDTAV